MFKEIKPKDAGEIKTAEKKNFQDIKPVGQFKDGESKGFLKNLFEKMELKNTLNDYIKDIKDKSEFPDIIEKKSFAVSDIKSVPHEMVVGLRKEFDTQKEKLISQWETINGKEWPTYKENIYAKDKNGNFKLNENGEKIILRKAGDKYDAHHIQPLKLGGKNEASNITPLHVEDHMKIHSKDSPCRNLIRRAGGIN